MRYKKYSLLYRGLVLAASSSYLLIVNGFATSGIKFNKAAVEILQDKKDNQYIIHNNSDYLLTNIKVPRGVKCSKNELTPGEIINCKVDSLTTNMPVMSAKVYNLKSLQNILVNNSSFEDATLDGWSKRGNVDIDNGSYKNRDGDFVSLILGDSTIEDGSTLSRVINIQDSKAYAVSILAASSQSDINSESFSYNYFKLFRF